MGERNWKAFVEYATSHYKQQFIGVFRAPMACCGRIDSPGSVCPHNLVINPTVKRDVEKLASLHLDHAYEVVDICTVWKDAMPKKPRTWDDGVDGDLICHLLFGVEDHPKAIAASTPESTRYLWKANVQFRCGNSRQQRKGDFCHETRYAHRQKLTLADLRR